MSRDSQIDLLRALCIVGLCFMHVSLSFTSIPYQFDFWPFHSNSPSLTLAGFCAFINSTAVPILFYLAGTSALKYFKGQDSHWFVKRFKKWSVLLILSYLICVIIVDLSIAQFEPRVNWFLVIFPPYAHGFLMNLMHLWFLVILILAEGLSWCIIRLKLVNKISELNPKYFAFALMLFHFLVVFTQKIGYLEAPYFLTVQKIVPGLVFIGYYFLGMIFPPYQLNFKINHGLFALILVAYFTIKYYTLEHYGNTHLFIVKGLTGLETYFDVFHFFNALFESTIVFLCLVYFLSQKIVIEKIKPIVNYVNLNAVAIYIAQIPLIFLFFIGVYLSNISDKHWLSLLKAKPMFNVNAKPLFLEFSFEIQPWLAAFFSFFIIACCLALLIKVKKLIVRN